MLLRGIITYICAVGCLACSTMHEAGAHKLPYSRDVIFSDEIQNSTADDAYDLILNRRPNWLRGRGIKSILYDVSYPVVYVNGSRHGKIESLSSVSVEGIREIRFFNSGDAAFRFGFDHPGGAILISI